MRHVIFSLNEYVMLCYVIECLQFSTEAVQRQFNVADKGRKPVQFSSCDVNAALHFGDHISVTHKC